MLTVIRNGSPSGLLTRSASTPARSRSATSSAWSRPISGSSAANSSPPRRPSRSTSRRPWRRVSATRCRARSPVRWPWLSLMFLKWSMSSISATQVVEAFGGLEHEFRLVQERVAVVQAGQGIGAGQQAQFLLHGLAPADVVAPDQGRRLAVDFQVARADHRPARRFPHSWASQPSTSGRAPPGRSAGGCIRWRWRTAGAG